MEIFSFNGSHRIKDGLPVLPGRLPVVGHMPSILLGGNPIHAMLEARERLGPLFWIDAGFGNWTLVCTEPEVFEVLRNRVTTSTHLQDVVGVFVGTSLIGQDGSPHHHMRSALNPPFTPRGIAAARVGEMTAELIAEQIAGWDSKGIVILDQTQKVALDIIFRIMGIEARELDDWRHQYREFLLSAFAFPFDVPFSPRRRGLRARAWLDERLREIFGALGEHGEPSFLRSIVHARDDEGQRLTERELLDNMRLLVLAGHETTASTMAWLAIVLAQRPDLWDTLCEEARKGPGLPRTPQELKAYPFAEALFRETLRLYPPAVSTSRKTTESITLCHHRIPPGTMVGVPVGVLGRHPALHEAPERFNPGRWLGKSGAPTSLELVPFGGGPHFCLGYHLAWMEVVQFAVALARELDARGLRPRLADGPAPEQRYMPLGRPTPTTRIEFAPSRSSRTDRAVS
jgi:cytochrome P450 monooxygenase